ncbi:hypothetical protein [Rothia sp. ZJ1223]|uniref:hypothetical protein n=1 Tax=Rothia sp. ZJ1223 TaxID=2811098 RepID=UPI00195C50F5|nr:hypothetical protein [Rothia sp. ZJ1223]MBM7052215.1 hypothetical protein [Rothia sp. ZJ1223]
MKSHLLNMLGVDNFVNVSIGGKIYNDNDIERIKINYGSGSYGITAKIPSAIIRLPGKISMSYNLPVNITYNIYGDIVRFVGRVGAQKYLDTGVGEDVSEIIATTHTIRLLRDENKYISEPGHHTPAHAIHYMYNLANTLKVPGGKGIISGSMWDKDTFTERKEYKAKEILGLLEKLGVAVTHNYDGSLSYRHPADRVDQMRKALENDMPLQRSNALSPATHEQPTSFVDTRPRLVYRVTGSTQQQIADYFSRLMRGVEIPLYTTDEEITDIQFSADYGNYKFPANRAVYNAISTSWQTPSITVDMLSLLNGNSYAQQLAKQIVTTPEGGFIIFGGDWPEELRGPKTVQGITETIDATGWKIELSLGDPRAVFGWNPEDPYHLMPEPRTLTWAQQTGKWAEETKKWSEK